MEHNSGNTPSAELINSIINKLITANHILHYHGVVDAYGHISARSPADPSTFLISKNLAPALVSKREDIETYRVSDASPVNPNAPKGYVERYIHSEIYKRYPSVDVVIHSHNHDVLPFSISSVPLRPVYHMAGVMGARVPVFDISLHYKASDEIHSLLINNEHLGSSLAAGMNPASLTTKMYNYITSSSSEPVSWPAYPTILMRGHGFTCIGKSIEEAVFRAIFTCNNARLQTSALNLQSGHSLGSLAARLSSTERTAGSAELDGIRYLSDRECKDSWTTMQNTLARPWKLWCEEVAHNELYKNEVIVERSE